MIKKLHVFLGSKNAKFVCRRCLTCSKNLDVLIKHIERCRQQDIKVIRLSKESHLMWKKYFHKIPLYFRIYGDFECKNSIAELQHIGKKSKNVFRQNRTCNGFYIVSELNDVLQSEYHSNFGENILEWFVNEVIKIEDKMTFYFRNTKNDIVLTRKDEEDFKNSTVCWFCELPLGGRAVRDH